MKRLLILVCLLLVVSCQKTGKREPEVVTIELENDQYDVALGTSIRIRALVNPVRLVANVEWSSSNPDIAEIRYGVVKGLSEGMAEITAKVEDVSKTCRVVVSRPPVQAIQLSETAVDLCRYERCPLQIRLTPKNAIPQKRSSSSSDESVAIYENGSIIATGEGETTIRIVFDDVSAECSVKVRANPKAVLLYSTVDNEKLEFFSLEHTSFDAEEQDHYYSKSLGRGFVIFETPPNCLLDRSCFGTLTELTLPQSITAIGDWCLQESQMEELIIPGNVKTVGGWFANDSPKLKIVVFEEGVEDVSGSLLSGCPNLEEIVFPKSLLSVAGFLPYSYNAWERKYERYNLKRIVFLSETPPVFSVKVPDHVMGYSEEMMSISYPDLGVFVPPGAVEAYKAAPLFQGIADRIYPIGE